MVDGFTSALIPTALPTPKPANSPHVVDKLARAMLAEVEPGGRNANPADLIVLVEDLELTNMHQPNVAVGHFLEAIKAALEWRQWKSAASREKAVKGLRERCSFHLMKPMVEAYFFGEPAAPTRAGSTRSNRFSTSQDVESFMIADPKYAAVPEGHRWWASPNRYQHPKKYLDCLCTPFVDDLSEKSEVHSYRETKHGPRALETLSWASVLASASHAPFARSLFEDLASALQAKNPFPGVCAPETRVKEGLLRNA